jgi:membrane protein YqaA with SNARE-associated domain
LGARFAGMRGCGRDRPELGNHRMKNPDPTSAATQRRGGPFRRLYEWVLSWADSRYGTPALAVISFAESSFFPVPPDVLQIALSVSKPKRSFYYASVSAAASLLGGILGWFIGYAIWSGVQGFFFEYVPGFTPESFDKVGRLYHDNAFLAILAAAFTPIPYKVFTIAAGVFHEYVPLSTLLAASALGRTGRFFLVACVTYFVGERAKMLLHRHLEWATFLLFALLVAGFLAVKFWL